MYALRGQVIQLENIGSLAGVTIEAKAIVRSRGGSTQSLTIEAFTAQSDRTLSDPVPSDERTRSEGEVVAASVRLVSGAPVRGQLFVILSVRGGQELCRGYLTSLSGVNLGTYEDSLGGQGHTSWRTVSDDVAGADVTEPLAVANTFRIVYGFVWYYDRSAAGGSVALAPQLRLPGPSNPANYTQTGIVMNITAQLDLTANQQGLIYTNTYGGGHGGVGITNDNDAALNIVDPRLNPTFFPLAVEENDLIEIFFNQASADAGDTMSIHILQEEWLLA